MLARDHALFEKLRLHRIARQPAWSRGLMETASQSLFQQHLYSIAGRFVYCPPYLLFYREFVRSVAQRHECAFERMPIDFAPDLDQAARSKKVHRFRPHDKCPSAFGGAFLQFGGEESG